MKRKFYGIYLNNSAISTILDIIRFLGEPDKIRSSHITLQGPFPSQGNISNFIAENNSKSRYNWTVELTTPANFFGERRSTVVILVNLHSLRDLIYKKDFGRDYAQPHITLYDGINRPFAEDLFQIVKSYDWRNFLEVSRLCEIEESKAIEEIFRPELHQFCDFYAKLVGDLSQISNMWQIGYLKRLDTIRNVLDRCVVASNGLPKVGGVGLAMTNALR
jgi:hypothetical protein